MPAMRRAASLLGLVAGLLSGCGSPPPGARSAPAASAPPAAPAPPPVQLDGPRCAADELAVGQWVAFDGRYGTDVWIVTSAERGGLWLEARQAVGGTMRWLVSTEGGALRALAIDFGSGETEVGTERLFQDTVLAGYGVSQMLGCEGLTFEPPPVTETIDGAVARLETWRMDDYAVIRTVWRDPRVPLGGMRRVDDGTTTTLFRWGTDGHPI